ncbi:hypothetical protein Emag_003582 [Eimeria magna]
MAEVISVQFVSPAVRLVLAVLQSVSPNLSGYLWRGRAALSLAEAQQSTKLRAPWRPSILTDHAKRVRAVALPVSEPTHALWILAVTSVSCFTRRQLLQSLKSACPALLLEPFSVHGGLLIFRCLVSCGFEEVGGVPVVKVHSCWVRLMRLLRRVRQRNGATLRLLLEEADDVWFLFNFIIEGDVIKATTVRKVQRETAGGGVATESRRMQLAIKVTACDFEGAAARLRVSGRICEETPFAKMGAHHTLEMGVTDEVLVVKEHWDRQHEIQLKEATDAASKAEALVLLIQGGLSNLLCVSSNLSRLLAKVEASLPKNRSAYSGYSKALSRFFRETADALIAHVDWNNLKALVIAGPGFYKDQFLEYFMQEAQKHEHRHILQKRQLIILAHASSAYRHALSELMADAAVKRLLSDTKAVKQATYIDQLYRMLNNTYQKNLQQDAVSSSSYQQSSLVCYGPNEVRRATDGGAVKVLMVSEGLLRSADLAQRRFYVQLLEDAAAGGAEALTFSDQHSTGEQLSLLGGVAAILRFPVFEEQEEPTFAQKTSNFKRQDP